MPTGTITKIDAIGDEDGGYGFIQPGSGGKQKKFKESAVKGNGFAKLKKGDPVKYDDHLKTQATNVEKV